MLNLILYLFIFFSWNNFIDSENIEINTPNACIKYNFELDAIMLMENDGHNCEQSESPIWTVTYESSGDWSCSSDGSHRCFPCKTDPEVHP